MMPPAAAKPSRREVFTPTPVVCHMCDLCEPFLSDPAHKVFEPGCGTGNFLVETLSRRLRRSSDPASALLSLSNLYGVDIDPTYLATARERLKSALLSSFKDQPLDYRFLPLVDLFLESNLIHGNLVHKYDEIIFVDWCRISDYEFRAQPTTLAEILEEHHG